LLHEQPNLKEIKTISFIGSGNVATHLAIALNSKGFTIDTILSQTLQNATELASKVNAKGIDQLNQLNQSSDLYIISLKDDVIDEYLKGLSIKGKLLVHTSGSYDTNRLANLSSKTGSFYPLQTFNKDISVDFSTIPIIIESENTETIASLLTVAKRLTANTHILTASQKKALHISAIGINNFTHFILSKSKEHCRANRLDFSLLNPLLKQTIESFSNEEKPLQKQTGPARRGDLTIIENHIEALSGDKEFQALYKDLSQYILSEFHGEKYKL
jgi:predicted short-subunit dehydrogenase-like oxidoreductase (DUF2520 family)